MPYDFVARIRGPRRDQWLQVFGTDRVYLRSPFPRWAILPGRGRSLVYDLDLDLLSTDQRRRMVDFLSERFGIPAVEVEAELSNHGVPLLADDLSIIVANPQRWLVD